MAAPVSRPRRPARLILLAVAAIAALLPVAAASPASAHTAACTGSVVAGPDHGYSPKQQYVSWLDDGAITTSLKFRSRVFQCGSYRHISFRYWYGRDHYDTGKVNLLFQFQTRDKYGRQYWHNCSTTSGSTYACNRLLTRAVYPGREVTGAGCGDSGCLLPRAGNFHYVTNALNNEQIVRVRAQLLIRHEISGNSKRWVTTCNMTEMRTDSNYCTRQQFVGG